MQDDRAELKIKFDRLAAFLDRHRIDGVFLTHRSSFAWITCGRDNHIANNSPNGVASILATKDSRVCFTNSIEAPRFAGEELAGSGIEVVSYPWQDSKAGAKKLVELIAGWRIAADNGDDGSFARYGVEFQPIPSDFTALRSSLTDAEIARYREGGRRASAAMEATCRALQRGMSETQMAGVLDQQMFAAGLQPIVTLIAGDQRIESFRHPIPTNLPVQQRVMLVSCALYGGLISNLTRFVSFGEPTAELKRRQQLVCNVDVAVNYATKPGRTIGEIFTEIENAYAANGFPGEYLKHHQGGPTGYLCRDFLAEPGMPARVVNQQAFAWNPSITGVKSEDTMLCSEAGIEFLTAPSAQWPTISVQHKGKTIKRPDVLVK